MSNVDHRWFDNVPAIADLSDADLAGVLRELGDEQTASLLEQRPRPRADMTFSVADVFSDPIYRGHGQIIGVIQQKAMGAYMAISPAATATAEPDLKTTRLKLALAHLYVASYPGFGVHDIMLQVWGRNQVDDLPTHSEEFNVNRCFSLSDGESTGTLNVPIATGLGAAADGIQLMFVTVNVTNSYDQDILKALDSSAVRNGLHLLANAQPVLAPFSGLAVELAKFLLVKKNKNVVVQKVQVGLDFSGAAGGAALRRGTYIVVQIPNRLFDAWKWSDWLYDLQSGVVVSASDKKQPLPYNSLAFTITEWGGA